MSTYGAVDIIREMLVSSRRLREKLAPYTYAEGIQETVTSCTETEAWCFYQLRCARALERGERLPTPPPGLKLYDHYADALDWLDHA